jgi:hypothetical protein
MAFGKNEYSKNGNVKVTQDGEVFSGLVFKGDFFASF